MGVLCSVCVYMCVLTSIKKLKKFFLNYLLAHSPVEIFQETEIKIGILNRE